MPTPNAANADNRPYVVVINQPSAYGTLVLFLILHIIMLVVGIMNINDCPVEKLIPIYLIVAGSIGILSKMLPAIIGPREHKVFAFILLFLYNFELIWMILGSVWVYSIYKPNFVKGDDPYCDETAYWLAFWLLTINWILFVLVIILMCCTICVSCILGPPEPNN